MHGQRMRLANLRLQLLQVQRRRDYRIFRQAECTGGLLCPPNQSAVHLPRALAEFCSFSDTLYSALLAYFDIMMLTSHYLPTVSLLFKFF